MTFIVFFNTWIVSHQLSSIKDLHIDYAVLSRKYSAADSMMKGRLNTKEFIVFLNSIDLKLSMDDLSTAMEELDSNHDGEVSWDEFITWYEKKEGIYIYFFLIFSFALILSFSL